MVSVIFGVVLGLVGMSVTWFVARRSRRRPLLQYALDFDVLVNPLDNLGHGSLDLELNGHPITSISRTYVALWNANGDALRRIDMVDSDPLRIVFAPGDSPLQSRVAFRSRPQTALDCRIDAGAVLIDYAFLDQGDGGVFEILHQGASPSLAGTVVGAVIRKRSDKNLTPRALNWMRDRSWRRRVLGRIQAGNLTKATAIPPVLFTLAAIPITIIEWLRHRHPRLINPTHYALATLAGQAKFAAKVQSAGQLSPLILAVLVFTVILVFASFATLALGGRRGFPRGIVAEQLDAS